MKMRATQAAGADKRPAAMKAALKGADVDLPIRREP